MFVCLLVLSFCLLFACVLRFECLLVCLECLPSCLFKNQQTIGHSPIRAFHIHNDILIILFWLPITTPIILSMLPRSWVIDQSWLCPAITDQLYWTMRVISVGHIRPNKDRDNWPWVNNGAWRKLCQGKHRPASQQLKELISGIKKRRGNQEFSFPWIIDRQHHVDTHGVGWLTRYLPSRIVAGLCQTSDDSQFKHITEMVQLGTYPSWLGLATTWVV